MDSTDSTKELLLIIIPEEKSKILYQAKIQINCR